ncbi:unnamed protein product, partial [Prorocentrum cordatum]
GKGKSSLTCSVCRAPRSTDLGARRLDQAVTNMHQQVLQAQQQQQDLLRQCQEYEQRFPELVAAQEAPLHGAASHWATGPMLSTRQFGVDLGSTMATTRERLTGGVRSTPRTSITGPALPFRQTSISPARCMGASVALRPLLQGGAATASAPGLHPPLCTAAPFCSAVWQAAVPVACVAAQNRALDPVPAGPG